MYDFYNDIGLFRFSIISPIINNTHNCASISEYIRFAASKTYTFNEKSYTFSESCIKNWYISYKKNGFDTLRSKEKNDKNKSRLIMGHDIFFNDTAINMQKIFKNAIKTYGKPKRLFVDNGGPYDNKQLTLICASLGIELIHAKPYTPEAKAKQERLFRTIKDG